MRTRQCHQSRTRRRAAIAMFAGSHAWHHTLSGKGKMIMLHLPGRRLHLWRSRVRAQMQKTRWPLREDSLERVERFQEEAENCILREMQRFQQKHGRRNKLIGKKDICGSHLLLCHTKARRGLQLSHQPNIAFVTAKPNAGIV